LLIHELLIYKYKVIKATAGRPSPNRDKRSKN